MVLWHRLAILNAGIIENGFFLFNGYLLNQSLILIIKLYKAIPDMIPMRAVMIKLAPTMFGGHISDPPWIFSFWFFSD